ncbi:MAG: ABC transporter permease [Gemmatimonadales bacterium]
MSGWLLRRGAQAVVTFLVASVIIFFLMRVIPGDPVAVLAGDRPQTAEQLARLRQRYCLDCSLAVQFGHFLRDAVRGDLGTSIRYQGRRVTTIIRERLPATLLLGGTVLLLNFTIGLALGAWQGVRKGRATDRVLSAVSLTGYAIPSFWLGLILAWLFATEWRILPAGGIHSVLLSPEAPVVTRMLDLGRHLILPALTLSIVSIAATMRYQRTAMIEVMSLDFIRTARAKGLPESAVLTRHAWRNALFPVITLFGLWLPILVTGSVFVESVFSWNGLGLLATEAIAGRDYPLLMGTTMLVAALVILGGLITDVAYLLLDPRVRVR